MQHTTYFWFCFGCLASIKLMHTLTINSGNVQLSKEYRREFNLFYSERILVISDSRKKMILTGWFKEQKLISSQFWKLEAQGASRVGFRRGLSSWGQDGYLLTVSSWGRRERERGREKRGGGGGRGREGRGEREIEREWASEQAFWCFFSQGHESYHVGSTLMASSSQDSISKYHHIGG